MMTVVAARPRRSIPRWALALLLLLFAILFFAPDRTVIIPLIEQNYHINTTESMPMGLYRTRPLIGQAIRNTEMLFCLSLPTIQRGQAVGVIFINGACSTGYAPLLKRVIAVPGDLVDTRHHNLIVNGIVIPLSAQLTAKRLLPLRSIAATLYYVEPGEAWGVSKELHGYDSRYFGAQHPEFTVSPLIVWNNRDMFPTISWRELFS